MKHFVKFGFIHVLWVDWILYIFAFFVNFKKSSNSWLRFIAIHWIRQRVSIFFFYVYSKYLWHFMHSLWSTITKEWPRSVFMIPLSHWNLPQNLGKICKHMWQTIKIEKKLLKNYCQRKFFLGLMEFVFPLSNFWYIKYKYK